MTTDRIDPVDILTRLEADQGLQGEVAQLKAKSTLTEVLGQAPPYNWTYIPSRVVRNAIAARYCLEQVALSRQRAPSEFSLTVRRFALAWESLATLREGGTNRELALLNAAAAYDFAGYEANAICLARGVLAAPSTSFIRIAGLAVARRFMGLAHSAWESMLLDGARLDSTEDVLQATAALLAVSGLQELAWFFLSGSKERLEKAQEFMAQAESGLMSVGAAEEATLIRTIRALVPVMEERATWTILGGISSSPKWRRYLMLLARGLSADLLAGTSIAELWPSQKHALDGGLLSDNRGKIVRMPTSAGKTRIAEMALVHTLVEQPGAKCIYVAPYRALVSEIESTLIAVLGDLGFQVSTALGGFETDELELFLSQNADVLVTTPEKLDLLNRLTPSYAAQVRLVILDEGHILGDQRRGIKYDMLLSRFKSVAPQARFIFLSAVVPDTTLQELAAWLKTGTDSILRTEWRPSVQRLAALRWSGSAGTLHYAVESDAPLLNQSFTPGIIRQQQIIFPNPATGRLLTRRFPDTANKSQIAAELALKFAEFGSVLVFCSVPQSTTAVGQAILDRIEWSSLAGIKDVPPPIDTSGTRSAQLAQEWLGDEHKVTKLLQRGVAVHYGDLPDAVRNAIESDYRAKRYRFLVATNTLAQGVNLPIRTVIVHSVWRGTSDNRERISARDYWNIAGRAGRAGEETDGTIIHIVRTDVDESDYFYYQTHRENLEPLDSALLRLMQQVAEGRLSDEAFRGAIDAEILALAAEETTDGPISARIAELVGDTLAAQQMPRAGLDLDILREKSISVANSITQDVPDADRRKVFASTGLTTRSCLHIDDHVVNNSAQVSRVMTGEEGPVNAAEIISEIAAGLSESEVDAAFAGSYVDLLREWMSGKPIAEIRSALGGDSPNIEQLAKFIENYFGGRLPWVVSGFLRIASHRLGLNTTDIPLAVRTLPAMIKIGVGFPEAAWAAAAGAASREAAIRIGTDYLSAVGGASIGADSRRTYTEFLEWLRPLTSEDLHHRYALQGAVLDETLKAFQRNVKNPFLAADVAYPLEFNIRGIAYEGRRQVAARALPGVEVLLKRDYDNLVDRNAVFVTLGNDILGYLPRDYAQFVAPELDAGWVGKGTVVRNELAAVPSVTVRISALSQ